MTDPEIHLMIPANHYIDFFGNKDIRYTIQHVLPELIPQIAEQSGISQNEIFNL